MRFQAARTTGLTLPEMLVAMGVMALLLSLAGVIFNETQQAISIGLHTKDAMAVNRSIGSQLERDFRHMLGPGKDHPRGFLVIVNERAAGPQELGQNGERGAVPVDQRNQQRFVRFDQIGFIVRTPETRPMHSLTQAPSGEAGAGTYRNNITSTDARVWYGHLQPIDNDDAPVPPLVNNWAFGRQAMLLTRSGGNTYYQPPLINAELDYSRTYTLRDLTGPNPAATQLPFIDSDEIDRYLDFVFGPLLTSDQRLKVRRSFEALENESVSDTFQPNKYAQLHPHLADGVSDFVVQFALRNPDGTIRRDQNDNSIIWFDGFNGGPNAGPTPASNDWPDGSYDPTVNVASGQAFVFRYNDTDNPSTADQQESNWPAMIRIRYRLHDPDGLLRSTAPNNPGRPIAGRWFEHTFELPDPDA